MNTIKTHLQSFFSGSKNWAIVYLFTIYLDTLMTLIGTHRFGMSSEANPIIRSAIQTGDFKLPLLLSASLILVMFLVLKGWNITITRGGYSYLSTKSRILRAAAWLLIPAYFYCTVFVWMYLLSYNNNPPFYGYYFMTLGKILHYYRIII